MKKSKFISLVLVSAALASCGSDKKPHRKKVYMRADESAPYTAVAEDQYSEEEEEEEGGRHRSHGMMYFYAFRPYGMYTPGVGYAKAGYYSTGVKESSNLGGNATKSSICRGGFGSSGYSVSS